MNTDGINKNNIQELLAKWQKILRLQDWDIELEVVDREWRKSGDVKIDLCNKQAVLLINSKPKCDNLNELIIHELLHIKLWGMDQMIEDLLNIVYGENDCDKKEFPETQFMTLLESTVQDLTKGYLELSNLGPVSFNRLKMDVEKEIN